MTATKLFRKPTNAVTGRYVAYRIKRSWALMLLCFIAMFFCTVVPFLINADYLTAKDNYMNTDRYISRISSYFTDNSVWCMILSGGLAVGAGCVSLSYLHNKVSAGFFHAIPEKRSGHFIASLASAAIDFVLPFIVNKLLLTLAVAANGILYRFVAVLLIKVTFLCILTYFSVLAVCYLAGMLTGTGAIHVIFTFYLLLILPVTVFAFEYWIGENTDYLVFDALSRLGQTGIFLTPLVRIGQIAVMCFEEPSLTTNLALIIELIAIPVTFVLAYLLYEKRPSECTGTPVIYRKLSEVVKYSVMFPMAFLSAQIFYSFDNTAIWMIFGFCVGIILTFMLMNTVLNRTTKAMFSGLKGLGIFTACTVFLFITSCTGIFGTLDYAVLPAKSLEISINGNGYEYVITDPAMIRRFRSEMKEFNKQLKTDRSSVINTVTSSYIDDVIEYDYYDSKEIAAESTSETPYGSDDILYDMLKSVRTNSFSVVYTDIFGTSTRYRYNNVFSTALTDMKAILLEIENASEVSDIDFDSEYFNSNLYLTFYVDKNDVTAAVKSDEHLANKLNYIFNMEEYDNSYDYCIITAEYKFNVSELTEFARKLGKDKFESFADRIMQKSVNTDPVQSMGCINLHFGDGDNYYSTNLPFSFNDIALVNSAIGESGIYKCSYINIGISNGAEYHEHIDLSAVPEIVPMLLNNYSANYVKDFTEDVEYVIVYDSANEKFSTVYDRNEIGEIMNSVAQISDNATISPFTPTDTDYVIYVGMRQKDDSYITYLLPQ